MSELVPIVQLLVIAGLVVVLVRERAAAARQLADFVRRSADERSELLERIQRPERVPASQRKSPPHKPDERPKDLVELARVGSVAPFADNENGAQRD